MYDWEKSALESIVGKRILSFEAADKAICFVGENERFYYELFADCCSETWLFRVRNAASLIGQTVEGIVEVPTDDVDVNDGMCRQESDQAYGIGVKTELGVCEIVYRNSSNGYYGGWIERSKETGKHPQTKEITSDYLAAKGE